MLFFIQRGTYAGLTVESIDKVLSFMHGYLYKRPTKGDCVVKYIWKLKCFNCTEKRPKKWSGLT